MLSAVVPVESVVPEVVVVVDVEALTESVPVESLLAESEALLSQATKAPAIANSTHNFFIVQW